MNSMHVIGLAGSEALAGALAEHLGCGSSKLFTRHFPDGETLVRIDAEVQGCTVVFAGSLDRVDEKTLPLLFAADAARELGASRVGLAAPYLAYMRQDARFQPGEAISSRTYARLLSSSLDFLVTVDPHLHRWQSLDQIYSLRSRVVPAAPAIAEWIRGHVERPLVVGPDAESAQWVGQVAALAGAPSTVMVKTRRGDRDVGVQLRDSGPWPGHTPVLVDDIISTGHTLMAAAGVLAEAGLPAPTCIGVHGLFDDAGLRQMQEAGIRQVVTCDTIPHPTNAISILTPFGEALREIAQAR